MASLQPEEFEQSTFSHVFPIGVLSIFVFALFALSISIGRHLGRQEIALSCDVLGHVAIADTVYVCAPAHPAHPVPAVRYVPALQGWSVSTL